MKGDGKDELYRGVVLWRAGKNWVISDGGTSLVYYSRAAARKAVCDGNDVAQRSAEYRRYKIARAKSPLGIAEAARSAHHGCKECRSVGFYEIDHCPVGKQLWDTLYAIQRAEEEKAKRAALSTEYLIEVLAERGFKVVQSD